MSDYTPFTDEVRLHFRRSIAEPDGVEVDGAFDRWLARHDAEIAQQERNRLAELVWNEKQLVFEAITKDPTNANLSAYQSGLYRALDIIEGENE